LKYTQEKVKRIKGITHYLCGGHSTFERKYPYVSKKVEANEQNLAKTS
jgi:hypothetical protein